MGSARTGIRWLVLGAVGCAAAAVLVLTWGRAPGPSGGDEDPGARASAQRGLRREVLVQGDDVPLPGREGRCVVELRAHAPGEASFDPWKVTGLELHVQHLNRGSLFEARATFGPDGACRLEGLLPGRYVLVHPAHGDPEGGKGDQFYRLRRGLEFPAVEGIVIVQDAPVELARAVHGIVPSGVDTVPEAAARLWPLGTRRTNHESGGLDVGFDWPDGADTWGAKVVVSGEDGEERPTVRLEVTDGRATAELRGLAPGPKRVAVRIPEVSGGGSPSYRLLARPAQVVRGQTVPVPIPSPAGGWTWIQGWVTTGPLSQGNFSLMAVLDGKTFGPVPIADSGRFRLRVPVFSAGALRLVEDFEGLCQEFELSPERDPAAPVEIPVPEGRVVIRLDPAASESFPDDASLALTPDGGGPQILRSLDHHWGFSVDHVPAGRYRARISCGQSQRQDPRFPVAELTVPEGPGEARVVIGGG